MKVGGLFSNYLVIKKPLPFWFYVPQTQQLNNILRRCHWQASPQGRAPHGSAKLRSLPETRQGAECGPRKHGDRSRSVLLYFSDNSPGFDHPGKQASRFIPNVIPLAGLVAPDTQWWCWRCWRSATTLSLVSWWLWRPLIPHTRQHPKLLILVRNTASSVTERFNSCDFSLCAKAECFFFWRKTW